MPKKQRRAALVSALSLRAGENAISVLETLAFDAPKTAQMAEVLRRLGLHEKRTLLLLGESDGNVVKSCRNLKNLRTTLAHQVSPYELLNCDAVLLTAGGLERMREVFIR